MKKTSSAVCDRYQHSAEQHAKVYANAVVSEQALLLVGMRDSNYVAVTAFTLSACSRCQSATLKCTPWCRHTCDPLRHNDRLQLLREVYDAKLPQCQQQPQRAAADVYANVAVDDLLFTISDTPRSRIVWQ
eukprot:1696-Heterococcus_DN1.PRE.1